MMEDFANQCSKSVEQAKLEAKTVSDCEAQLKVRMVFDYVIGEMQFKLKGPFCGTKDLC